MIESAFAASSDSAATTPAGTVLEVTTTLMQDYRSQTPFSPRTSPGHPFLTAGMDGSLQVNSWDGLGLYRAVEDSSSSTGWIERGVPFAAPEPPYQSWVSFLPSVAGPGRIAKWGADNFEIAQIADNGHVSEFRVAGKNDRRSPALLASPNEGLMLPPIAPLPDACYVLEGTFAPSVALWLRDLTTFEALPLPVFPGNAQTWYWYQPLPAQADGVYRCVALDFDLRLVCLNAVLTLDRSAFEVSFDVLATLPSTQSPIGSSGVVLDHGNGAVELLVLQGVTVTSYSGTVNPGSTSPVAWAAGVAVTLPTVDPAKFRPYCAWAPPSSSGVEVIMSASDGTANGFWSIERPIGGSWSEPVLVDGPANVSDVLPGTGAAILARLPSTLGWDKFEVWRRQEDGGLDAEFVDLEQQDYQPVETQGYRIGITASASNLPLDGVTLQVSSSERVRCVVNGVDTLLRPQSTSVTAAGTTWITLPLDQRLGVPTLQVSGGGLAAPVIIVPDHDVQTFLSNVTAAQLAGASDPRTGAAVFAAGIDVAKVSSILNQTMALVPAMRCATDGAGVGNDPAARAGLGRWQLQVTAAGTVYTDLDPAAASSRRNALLQTHNGPITPLGFFDDVWDWVEGAAHAVWDGIAHVTELVVDGLQLTVQLVIDGLTYVYDAVINTVARAFDAINFVLNAFGTVMGAVVGWLLSHLGFLFDWPAIKSRRDQLRASFRSTLSQGMARIPDPAIAASGVALTINSSQASVDAWIDSYRSSPAAAAPITTTTSPTDSSFSKMLSGPLSPATEVTWLLEKVAKSLTEQLSIVTAFDLEGLDAATSKVEAASVAAAQAMTPSLDDIKAIAQSWAADPTLLMTARTDAILTVLQQHLDPAMSATASLVTAGGDITHLLWANTDRLIDWLDSPLPKSYAAGFYRGLTGNDLSCYDLVCLAVAVPSAAGSAAVEALAEGVDYRTGGQILAGLATLLTVIEATTEVMQLSLASTVVGVLNLLSAGLRAVFVLLEDNEYGPLVAGAALLPAVVRIHGLIRPLSPTTRRTLSLAATVVYVVLQLARQASPNAATLGVLSILQKLLSVGASLQTEPLDLESAVAYGAVQGILTGATAGLYYLATAPEVQA